MRWESGLILNFLNANAMGLTVKQISARQTHDLRQRVLRPGRPLQDCMWENDEDSQTVHFGVSDSGTIVAIASLYARAHAVIGPENTFQLRGMAVSESHRGLGLGRKLLDAAVNHVRNIQGGGTLWFNARESAVGFYRKCGFETLGHPFDIPNIGPHSLMFKHIA